jgi:hypothetical protein
MNAIMSRSVVQEPGFAGRICREYQDQARIARPIEPLRGVTRENTLLPWPSEMLDFQLRLIDNIALYSRSQGGHTRRLRNPKDSR